MRKQTRAAFHMGELKHKHNLTPAPQRRKNKNKTLAEFEHHALTCMHILRMPGEISTILDVDLTWVLASVLFS